MHRAMTFLLALALLTTSVAAQARLTGTVSATGPTGGITIQDVPTPLVSSDVAGFTLAAPKLFWYNGVPACPPRLAVAGVAPAAAYTQSISRIPAHGGLRRDLYQQGEDCDGGKITSNIVADANYLYWLAPTGLVRLSTSANPGDPYQLVNALVKPYGQLADGADKTFYLSPSGPNTEIGYVLKSNNQRVNLTTVGGTAANLQFDGGYVYYMLNGTLYRLNPGVDVGIPLASGVTGYYAEGLRFLGCIIQPPVCFRSNSVYIGQSTTVRIYNNLNDTLGNVIYTSGDVNDTVYNLVTDLGHLFIFERQPTSCGLLFCPTNDVLFRMNRNGASPVPIYTYLEGVGAFTSGLTTDGTFLYWQENGAVQRLPNDASALPQINMFITGMEITQGIQNLSNGVPLIQNRRTFVRVYVKSAGASVPGVTAQLSSGLGTLQPVNPVGASITVRANPDRNDINQSFLFELPWSWTQGPIQLTATLNPFKYPLEPTYADDVSSTGNLVFKASPSLSVQFFRLNYKIGNTTYSPSITNDVLKTYSWMMRAYPIGGAIGQSFKPTLWDVAGDTKLGNWVNRSSGDCTKSKIGASDLALCASYYTNGWLKYYRDHAWVPNTTAFYYGMISDTSNNFPRGQAIYDKTSVGPAGKPGQFFSLGQGWDTDGTYADWYAGHEIGHSLGRAHPNAGSDDPATTAGENCGHSRSDAGFPYGNTSTARAPIGPADGSMEGFDVGDPSFGIAKAIYPSSVWNDVMSYCSNQWLSDYTYNGMYNYMIGHPSLASAALKSEQLAVTGDFLSVAGIINPADSSAGFSSVRRLTTVANQPPLTPGDYRIRLLSAGNTQLADYAFTPNPSEESQALGFDQVVNFVAGTRTIQIVRTSDSQVLASYAVSANSPVISNVVLQAAPSPVTGVVTLGWTASDPDGDALSFDIFYSRDNGATFQPAKMGATGASTQLDTSVLGGSGTAILRVVASDGANTAEASSVPFTMANKPPQPYILTPGDATHIHYGQLVNFSGMAFDVQDGTVGAGGLVWKNAAGTSLGTGPLISLDSLPVGDNVITLSATNSVGQLASASVTVIVDDDLNLPGPTLTAGPGQVGWQVGAETTAAQTAQVSIGNAGSGALDWTATSDQPWLTLSAASGSIADGGDPSTLTLTASPSGLAPNQTYSAKLTLTKAADSNSPAQTVMVPVSLSIGDVWNNIQSTLVLGQKIYLPAIRR
jgi:hypothetical protein